MGLRQKTDEEHLDEYFGYQSSDLASIPGEDWVCCCGKVNPEIQNHCVHCGKQKGTCEL